MHIWLLSSISNGKKYSRYILLRASPCSYSQGCRAGSEIWIDSYKVSGKCLSCEHEHLRSSLRIHEKKRWLGCLMGFDMGAGKLGTTETDGLGG